MLAMWIRSYLRLHAVFYIPLDRLLKDNSEAFEKHRETQALLHKNTIKLDKVPKTTIGDLEENTAYVFSVQAGNTCGQSSFSEFSDVFTTGTGL